MAVAIQCAGIFNRYRIDQRFGAAIDNDGESAYAGKTDSANRDIRAVTDNNSISGVIVGESRFLQREIPVGFQVCAVAKNRKAGEGDVRSAIDHDRGAALKAGIEHKRTARRAANQFDIVSAFGYDKRSREMRFAGRQFHQRFPAIQFRLRVTSAGGKAESHETCDARDALQNCRTTQAGGAAAGAGGGGGCDGGFSFGVAAFTTAFTGLIRM